MANNNGSFTFAANTIPAGQSLLVNVQGERFRLIQATAALGISTDSASEQSYIQGQGQLFTQERNFKWVLLFNRNPAPVYFELWAGYGDFLDTRATFTEKVSDTLMPAGYSGTLSTTAFILTGIPPAGYATRKDVKISNNDSTNPIIIRDKNHNRVATVLAQTSQVHGTSGYLELLTAGAAVSADIGENWYILGS